MKITRIEKWKVVVPMRPDSINSPEYTSEDDELSTFWKVPKHIIRIHTSDSGIVGIGETGRGCPAEAVDRAIAALVGREVESIDLHRLPIEGWAPYMAFEMALFDIVGKQQLPFLSALPRHRPGRCPGAAAPAGGGLRGSGAQGQPRLVRAPAR